MPNITVANVDWSAQAIEIVPPLPTGLQLWSILGGTLALSQRNLAPAANGAQNGVVGTPAISSNYATFTQGTNYFTTGIADAAGSKMEYAVVRASGLAAGQTVYFAGMYDGFGTGKGGGYLGLQFQANGTTNVLLGREEYSGAAQNAAVTLPSSVGNWRFVAKLTTPGVGFTIYDLTGNVNTSYANTIAADLSADNFQIGNVPGVPASANTNDIAFIGRNQSGTHTFTLADLNTVYASVKKLMANRGITI